MAADLWDRRRERTARSRQHRGCRGSDHERSREDALANARLCTLEELRGPLYEGLETWSKFCIDAVDSW